MKKNITLRSTTYNDLEALYHFQLDEEANRMAAFTAIDPTDKAAFLEKYSRLLKNPDINMQSILRDNEIVGSIAKYVSDDKPEITYWIGRKYWGLGIASAALHDFLDVVSERPIYARVAFDNLASQRVLETCGFVRTGSEMGFANARKMEIEEFIYQLEN